MVRGRKLLTTDLAVRKKTEPGYHPAGDGLWLQISVGGAKSWIFRYLMNGREREMGLGSFKVCGLADARAKASEYRKQCRDGIDPIDARKAQRAQEKQHALLAAQKAMTFDEAAKAYITAHRAGWKNLKHAGQWENTIATYVSPIIGNFHIENISTAHVLNVLDPIWQKKTETATRVRGRIESILDYWAALMEVQHYSNPARWKGHLDNLLPHRSAMAGAGVEAAKREHHSALPYTEIGAFFVALREQVGVTALALEFTILTAARTGEVIGAKWQEIDEDERVFTIPAERMKAKKEHRVPLCDRAMQIIKLMKPLGSEFVFPGRGEGKGLSNMSMLQLMRRMKVDAVPHGFRSTFRDWAAEQTNYPREVAEMALAHTVADKVEAAYRRGDLFEKRRLLMDAWANYCNRPQSAGDVVPIKRKSAKA